MFDFNPPPPPVLDKVPKGVVLLWTSLWAGLLIGLLVVAAFTDLKISHAQYKAARSVAAVVLVVLAFVGILRALDLVGKKDGKPWYTVGFLVALVLFWGLGPPTWFFVEYYLFDQGTFELPEDLKKDFDAAMLLHDDKAAAQIRSAFLASTKSYADMASKIWVAVGAALATTIGLAKR